MGVMRWRTLQSFYLYLLKNALVTVIIVCFATLFRTGLNLLCRVFAERSEAGLCVLECWRCYRPPARSHTCGCWSVLEAVASWEQPCPRSPAANGGGLRWAVHCRQPRHQHQGSAAAPAPRNTAPHIQQQQHPKTESKRLNVPQNGFYPLFLWTHFENVTLQGVNQWLAGDGALWMHVAGSVRWWMDSL